jgi:hypothetical protein
MSKRWSSLLVAGAVAAISAPALAKGGVPPGEYLCYQYNGTSYQYLGGFKLKSHGKYLALYRGGRPIRGGSGKYAVKGKNVKFKSGPYKTFTGKARIATGGATVIDITLKSDHSVGQSCSHK